MRKRTALFTAVAGTLLLAVSLYAGPGKPNFGTAIYVDGHAYGTKGTTPLPAPNAYNLQSFDPLYVFDNSNNPEGQPSIAVSAPGDTDYNGGRWIVYTVEWTSDGFMYYGYVPVLTSKDQIDQEEMAGRLTVNQGSFPDGPPPFIQCPLLPAKDAN